MSGSDKFLNMEEGGHLKGSILPSPPGLVDPNRGSTAAAPAPAAVSAAPAPAAVPAAPVQAVSASSRTFSSRTFAQLQIGEYVFSLQATKGKGSILGKEAQFRIIVSPPLPKGKTEEDIFKEVFGEVDAKDHNSQKPGRAYFKNEGDMWNFLKNRNVEITFKNNERFFPLSVCPNYDAIKQVRKTAPQMAEFLVNKSKSIQPLAPSPEERIKTDPKR